MNLLSANIVVLVISLTTAITNRSHRQLKFHDNDGFNSWYQQLQQDQPSVYTEENRDYYNQYYTAYYGNSYEQQPQQQQESHQEQQQQITYYQGNSDGL